MSKPSESDLWKLFPDDDDECNIFDMLASLDEDALEEIEREDFILSLSGVEEDAALRIELRREYIARIREMMETSAESRKKALDAFKNKKGSFSRSSGT